MNEETNSSAEVSENHNNEEFDPSKLLEMAKLFSTLMSNGDENEDGVEDGEEHTEETNNDKKTQTNTNPNNMLQMFEMVKLFSNLMKNTNTQNQPSQELPTQSQTSSQATYGPTSILFDESIHTPQMKVVKAAIPYMIPSHQKMLGVFIKSLELKKVMDVYKNDDTPLSSMNLSTNPKWQFDMLNSIRPHCSEEKQCMVDMMTRMMDIGDLMKKMNSYKSTESPKPQPTTSQNKPDQKQSLLNALSPMLNDNQKQMFNMLSTLMGSMQS